MLSGKMRRRKGRDDYAETRASECRALLETRSLQCRLECIFEQVKMRLTARHVRGSEGRIKNDGPTSSVKASGNIHPGCQCLVLVDYKEHGSGVSSNDGPYCVDAKNLPPHGLMAIKKWQQA
jgi:hypothetical protein